MNTSELQIGDWVYNAHHMKEIRMTPYDFFTHGHLNGHQFVRENAQPCLGRDLEPISITAEILEKNGFIRKHPESEKRAYWILRVAGGNVKVKRNWGYFYFEVTGTPLEMGMFLPHFEGHLAFVHELQHALRLCRIQDEIKL